MISRARRLGIASAMLFAAACRPVPILGPAPAPAAVPTAPVVSSLSFSSQPDSGPVISSGRAGLPILPADPNIYVDAEGYHLFYSTLFCRQGAVWIYSWDPAKPYDCNIGKVITTIAYAFSADRGLTWTFRQTPVILQDSTGFDSFRIETAAVFRVGDVLYLAYSGDGDLNGKRLKGRYQIGLGRFDLGGQSVHSAMMDESRRFERRPTPWLPWDLTPGRFDNSVQEPSITRGPQGLVLFYIGLGFKLPNEPVGVPGQGIERVELGRAVLDENLNVVSRSDRSVFDGVNLPEVHYYEGAYHLFAATLTGQGQVGEAIVHATSVDGIQWTTPETVLTHGNVPGFNDWGLTAPTVAVEADRIVLFHTAIGTEPRPCFPVPPQGRWGVPMRDNTMCTFLTVARAVASRTNPSQGR